MATFIESGMVVRLAHVCIAAEDLVASERFYVDGLGMELAFDFIRSGERIGFYLRVGEGTFIEVFSMRGAKATERPLIGHFCLEVADIDATLAQLQACGVAVSAKKLGADDAWQAWTRDPSGVRIELMQYRASSSQFTGRAVKLD